MRRAILALVMLGGCDADSTVRVVPVAAGRSAAAAARDMERIESAMNELGTPWEFSISPTGAISVELVDVAAEYPEGMHIRAGCSAFVRAGMEPQTLIHELGHALGLEHVDGPPSNAMRTEWAEPGPWLEDWQLDAVAKYADRLAVTCSR